MCAGRGGFPDPRGNTVTFSAGVVDENWRSASCSLTLRGNQHGKYQGMGDLRDLLDLAC